MNICNHCRHRLAETAMRPLAGRAPLIHNDKDYSRDWVYLDFIKARDTVDMILNHPDFRNVKVIYSFQAQEKLDECKRLKEISGSVYKSATALVEHVCYYVENLRCAGIPHYSETIGVDTLLAWKDFNV
jgi:hypothetical protein